MSITVRDCFKLPSLRNAEVLAGHAGLDQYVSTVSVLEYAKTFAMANPLFLGNEIILTAFISIKDDVDAQCEAIRRLHAVGEAAIVLYYVGYYMENVDQKLVQVANELDFPLIVMPRNDYSLRYSDVITEVLMHIFRDQQNETRFATQLLRQISMMREQQRSISGILRLLSDRCQYTFLLVDEDGRDCGFALWPMSINEEFRNSVYDHIDESDDFPVTFLWKDCNYVICKNSFATKMKSRFTLFSIMAAGTTEDTKLLQASEVLQSSYDIWDDDLRKKTQDDLVRMVLVEPADEVYRFANSMRLDLHPLRIMWVICPSPAEKYTYGSADRANIKYEIKKHLRANRKTGIVDTFDNSVVAFMNDDKYLEFDKDLCESLTKYLQEQYPGMILTWCGALDSITDAKRAYLLLEEYFPTACAMAGPDVLRLCKEAEAEGCDGIFINCFGDPAVKAARELVNIPVFGGFEPAMHLALGLADKIAIISVMKNVLPMIEGEVAKSHFDGRVCCVRSIDIPVEELQQHDRLVKALIEEAVNAITTDGAQAVALGCTAMVDVAEDVQAGLLLKGYDIPVIEAAQAAVMLLELSAKMGLKQSRITYMRPPQR